jgi:hypothetical protein
MFDLHAAVSHACDRVAVEWAKLEAAGVDPSTVRTLNDPRDIALPYARARHEFLALIQRCHDEGESIAFRHQVFVAGGLNFNPGVRIPSVSFFASLVLLLGLLNILVTSSPASPGVSAVLVLCLGIVCLDWHRVCRYLGYLKIQLGVRLA